MTEKGLKMADGTVVAVDALICATGFDTSYRPNFPVIGLKGDLRSIWQEEPRAYFSIAAAGVPNYFGKMKRYPAPSVAGQPNLLILTHL